MKKHDVSLILIVIIGFGLSLTAFFYVKNWEDDSILQEKQRQVDGHVRGLRQTILNFGSVLYSIRGLYNVHNGIELKDFKNFFRQRGILTQEVLQGVAWVPAVSTRELPFIQQIAQRDTPELRFWELAADGHAQPIQSRPLHFPISYLESSNLDSLLGFDLSSNPQLRQTLETARNQGQLLMSDATYLPSSAGNMLGVYLVLPVYLRETAELPERQRELKGFVVGIVVLNSLIDRELRLHKLRSDVFWKVTDETPGAQITQLYRPAWFPKENSQNTIELTSAPLEFSELGKRLWRIGLYSAGERLEVEQRYTSWMVLLIGILFTLGVLRYTHIILTRARWAENMVTERTQGLRVANESLNTEIEARNKITRDLSASQQRFQSIFNEAALGIAQIDLTGRIISCNKSLQKMLGFSETELQTHLLHELAYAEDAQTEQEMLRNLLNGKYDTFLVAQRYQRKDESIVWTNQSCSIVRSAGEPFIICMMEDITERKYAEEARLDAEKRYRDIFENAIEGIFQTTPDGHYINVNPAFVRIFGYQSPEQMQHEINEVQAQLYVDPKERIRFITLLETHSEIQNFEYQARKRDGNVIWVNETTRLVRDSDGNIAYYEGMVEDITKRKYAEAKLLYDASHDQLTGLFNRNTFIAKLSETLMRLHASPSTNIDCITFAVLFVDLDRFKVVNDSMGHWAGDQLLTEIARRLLQETDPTQDVVARFGGDEFALILHNAKGGTAEVLEQRVEQLQLQLSKPYSLEQQIFNTTASIGIALGTPEYQDPEEMLRDADIAMYEAKYRGRGRIMIFQEGMHTEVVNMLRMESDIRKGLERKEFCLYYQPIVSLKTRHIVSLEALVRWEHPEYGLVMPDKFIPVAEETGLIRELGLWVFQEACEQLKRWQQQFPMLEDLGMNINVSPIQLKQPDLVQKIQEIINNSGIRGETCRIEITESAIMQDPEHLLEILQELKQLNVKLYIDDFGTGYSSLSYLQQFPIDALKIDKGFIREIDTHGKSAKIAKAIISLGEAFGIKVVAEGVETNFQVMVLETAGCHHVQGFFFSRPQDVHHIEVYLQQQAIAIEAGLVPVY